MLLQVTRDLIDDYDKAGLQISKGYRRIYSKSSFKRMGQEEKGRRRMCTCCDSFEDPTFSVAWIRRPHTVCHERY